MNFIKIKGREGIGREAGRKLYKKLPDKRALGKKGREKSYLSFLIKEYNILSISVNFSSISKYLLLLLI